MEAVIRAIAPGLEIATNTVAFATEFLPLRLSPSIFRNKRVSRCHFAATCAGINEEMTSYFVSRRKFSFNLKIAQLYINLAAM